MTEATKCVFGNLGIVVVVLSNIFCVEGYYDFQGILLLIGIILLSLSINTNE